jgi:hypothetical protein
LGPLDFGLDSRCCPWNPCFFFAMMTSLSDVPYSRVPALGAYRRVRMKNLRTLRRISLGPCEGGIKRP